MAWTVKRSTYHHGDLRQALIKSAIELITEKGLVGASLREVARHAGVSHNAPYRHFPDKAALVAAVAEAGFLELAQRLRNGYASGRDPVEAFMALAEAYLQFAAENPAQYQLMFDHKQIHKESYPSLRAAEKALFELGIEGVKACQEIKAFSPGNPKVLGLTAWSTVHGLAYLIQEGALDWFGLSAKERQSLATQVIATVFVGLAHPDLPRTP